VENTLKNLLKSIRRNDDDDAVTLDNVINVGNKIDLVDEKSRNFNDLITVSSTTLSGMNDLMIKIEDLLLKTTDRIKMTIRVPMGGEEMQWLYKNSAVTSSDADPKDNQKLLLHVVISRTALDQFKHHFISGGRK
jgi:50S ribosomal subunit-associated GTPase HflX